MMIMKAPAPPKKQLGATPEKAMPRTAGRMCGWRGFNVARQDNGNVLVNALIIFGVDAMSEESKAEGIAVRKKN